MTKSVGTETVICIKMADDIPQRVKSAVEKVIQTEEIIKSNVEIKRCYDSGNFFNSKIYFANVKGESKGGDIILDLLIKSTFSDEVENIAVSENPLFVTETFFYEELSRMLKDLEVEAKIPDYDKYRVVKYFNINRLDLIIFEDMTKKGYKVIQNGQVVSLKFAENAMKNLAHFHAFTFILRKKNPDYFQTKLTKTSEHIFAEEYDAFIFNMAKKAEDVLVSEDLKVRFRKYAQDLTKKIKEFYKTENSSINVLNHGDYRAGNILYTELDDGEIVQIPIDYQQINYGKPMLDMFYFLMCDTDTEFRKKYMYHLRDHYYDCLRKRLQYFDIDSEEVYPRKAYEEDFSARLHLAVFYGIQVLPFLLATKDDVPDLSKNNLGDLSISTSLEYDRRIRSLVEEAAEWGIL